MKYYIKCNFECGGYINKEDKIQPHGSHCVGPKKSYFHLKIARSLKISFIKYHIFLKTGYTAKIIRHA